MALDWTYQFRPSSLKLLWSTESRQTNAYSTDAIDGSLTRSGTCSDVWIDQTEAEESICKPTRSKLVEVQGWRAQPAQAIPRDGQGVRKQWQCHLKAFQKGYGIWKRSIRVKEEPSGQKHSSSLPLTATYHAAFSRKRAHSVRRYSLGTVHRDSCEQIRYQRHHVLTVRLIWHWAVRITTDRQSISDQRSGWRPRRTFQELAGSLFALYSNWTAKCETSRP